MNIKLTSNLALTTVDLLAVKTHAAFTLPEGLWTITSIGKVHDNKTVNKTEVTATCNDYVYMFSLFPESDDIYLYQQVLAAYSETEKEWADTVMTLGQKQLDVDDVLYARCFQSEAPRVAPFEYAVDLETSGAHHALTNGYMQYVRDTDAGSLLNCKEYLLTVIERNHTAQEACIKYYIGYKLHKSTLQIL